VTWVRALAATSLLAWHAALFAQAPAAGPVFEVRRFEVTDATLVSRGEIDAALAPFLGTDRTIADLQQARAALESLYAQRGYGATQVVLPEQEIKDGIVQLRVVEARVGRIAVEGNKYFDEENIRASLPALAPGQPLDTTRVASELRLANESPVKQTTVVLKGADSAGEVDAQVRVADQRPYRFSLSLDNTGTPQTGEYRIGVGFQEANMWNLDHVLNLQFVTAPSKEDDPSQLSLSPNNNVFIFGAGYHIPLYRLGDSIDLVAGYANVDSGVVQNLYNISGSGRVYAARYNFGLPRIGAVEQKLTLGFDSRYYDNNVVPVGTTTAIVPDYVLHPLSLGYSGVWRGDSDELSFYATGVRNIPYGQNGDQAQFNLVRPGADASYTLSRFNFNWLHRFAHDVQARARFAAQYTRDELLSGEQFGLGGMDSVRGYYEREYAGDKGYSGTFEVYSPDLAASLSQGIRARLVAFYDYGSAWLNNPQVFEAPVTRISAAGPGIRVAYKTDLSLRLDYGFIIAKGTPPTTSSGRVNFSLVWVF
jgi:hemolysin activation/secretion protein